MVNPFVAPEHVGIGSELLEWAENYLMKEHEQIKRPHGNQVVCPFVEASVKANSFYMVFHPEVNGTDPTVIADLIESYTTPFKRAAPYGEKEQIKKALLVVFPNVGPENYYALDICHEIIKPSMVDQGLMVGQFHPNCTEVAAHNRSWQDVSKAPHPFIAMRNMALHDIMFLGEADRQWFLIYQNKFGHKFKDPDLIDEHDKHLIQYYAAAHRKWQD